MEVLKHGPPDFCNMIFSSLPKGTCRLLPLRALYSTVTTGHTDVTAACENSKPVDASGSPGSHGFPGSPGSQGCLMDGVATMPTTRAHELQVLVNQKWNPDSGQG